MSVSPLSPSLSLQPIETHCLSDAISPDQTPNTQEVLHAAKTPNIQVLQEILEFPPEKYWSDLPLHDVCYLVIFKVFCNFYDSVKKPLQEKAFFSFSTILYELNRTSCVTDEWVDWLEEESSELSTSFSLPTEFSSQMQAICALLRNPNHSLSSSSPAPTLEIRAQGLAYFAKLQKAAYDISLQFRESTLNKVKINLAGFTHIHNVFPQRILSNKGLKENAKKLQLSPEKAASTLATGKIFRSIFETLLQKITTVLIPVVKYQLISIEELKIPPELTSIYAIAERMTKHSAKIVSLSNAIQIKDEEMYDAVKTVTNSFLLAIGLYAQERTLEEIFETFLGMELEAQSAFFFQIENFLLSENEEIQNEKNLQGFLDYIQMLDTHIYKGKKEELERKKALTKMVGTQKYHLSEKLCDKLIDIAIQSAEDFDRKTARLNEQYHYSVYEHSLVKAESSSYFFYLKTSLEGLQNNPEIDEKEKSDSKAMLRAIFSGLINDLYSHATSKEALKKLREKYKESKDITFLRENIERFYSLRDCFTKSNYFCFGFLSRFLPILTDMYEKEHNKSIEAYIQELSSLPKKPSSPIVKTHSPSEHKPKLAPISPSSKENAAPVAADLKHPPSFSPVEEFFLHFTQISPRRIFHNPKTLKTSAGSIEQIYHFLIYTTSKNLFQRLALQEIEGKKVSLCQKEALFSSNLHASHMVMELGLNRLRTIQKQGTIPMHNLSYLIGGLDLSASIRHYCHRFPHTNLEVRYPYTHKNDLVTNQSSLDLLSKAQVHFHEGIVPLMQELQKYYGFPPLDFSVFSEVETVSPKEKISKKAEHLLQILSSIIEDTHPLLLSSTASELKNSLAHLIRLKGLIELLKEEPSQRNYLLFLHQMTSAMQHVFETALFAYSSLIGLPLQTHNLESYMNLFRVEEENILSKEELASLLHFNTKKALDYPIASLCEHGNTNAQPLWDAFLISFEAFAIGEGFSSKKKTDITQKYLVLLEDIEKGLQILEKISQKTLTT